MNKENSIVIFNQKNVRRHWDADKELWYFSVIDVIEILTDSASPRCYWSDLKIKVSLPQMRESNFLSETNRFLDTSRIANRRASAASFDLSAY